MPWNAVWPSINNAFVEISPVLSLKLHCLP
jgi:hypothetical protein